jgi:two-component system phosphate regulon response regulator PhoB
MPEEAPLGSVARRLAATEHVLVVEDERDIADFLRAYFRAAGYAFTHIDPDTPLAVLEALDEHQPDCVLLDLNLRGFSGVGAYRLLRSEERYALLPVIVVSARPDARELLSGIGGVDAFVTKPFNVNTLADLVAERIASAAQLRADTASDPVTGLLGQDYVEARLVDELTVVAPDRPAAFALVRLLSAADITTAVGAHGTDYVARELVRRARELMPSDAALGLTHTDELTILLPGCTSGQAVDLLSDAARAIESVRLPGGAEVEIRLAVGVAAYPEHAAVADELYMAADAALADAVDKGHPVAVAI